MANRYMAAKPGPWVDLSLTLPVFLGYQLGVVFLRVRNGTDLLTSQLLAIAHGDRLLYFGLTSAIGLGMVILFGVLGRGHALRPGKVLQVMVEGAAYAAAMGWATSWVVGKLFAEVAPAVDGGPVAALVMSLGAGFYEELAFRALLFGIGGQLLGWALAGPARLGANRGASGSGLKGTVAVSAWAVACAVGFSAMHYVGPLGDAFDPRSFVARAVLGLALTVIYATRGFAAAVWTHALYDAWVLVF